MSSVDAILIISPERWDQHFVSKHHYAMTLARRGARVLFLNPPDDKLASLSLEDAEECPGVTVVDGPRVAPGLRFYPGALRRRLERRWLEKLEVRAGVHVRTVWLFENSRFFDMGFAGNRLKIYHQVDLNQVFHPELAAKTADVVFCTTDLILKKLKLHNERVFKIHHGLATVEEPLALTAEQKTRFQHAGPHAMYIGNLDMTYLDVDVLVDVVKRFPMVRFHLIGGYSENGILRRALSGEENVEWWGKIDFRQIPAALSHADILLVTYRADRADDQASPHKFMEYFASGKVVVATYTDEYKNKQDLLVMAEPGADFCTMFDDVIEDLERYNSPPQMSKRQDFAHQHQYGKQLAKIEKHCQRAGLSSPITSKPNHNLLTGVGESPAESHEKQ